jgi:hypothetical protein
LRLAKYFSDRAETHFPSPPVDFYRILEFADLRAIRLQVELCAEALWFSLKHSNSIVQVGELPSGDLTRSAGRVDQGSAIAHESGLCNCVLKDKPRCLGAFRSNKHFSWPTMRFDDGSKFSRIRAMHFFHSRMVALEQAAVSFQLSADQFVASLQAEEVIFKVVEHLSGRFRRLTFELSWRRRHGALDSKRKMGHRPSA